MITLILRTKDTTILYVPYIYNKCFNNFSNKITFVKWLIKWFWYLEKTLNNNFFAINKLKIS